jgi:hypothetical protein
MPMHHCHGEANARYEPNEDQQGTLHPVVGPKRSLSLTMSARTQNKAAAAEGVGATACCCC